MFARIQRNPLKKSKKFDKKPDDQNLGMDPNQISP